MNSQKAFQTACIAVAIVAFTLSSMACGCGYSLPSLSPETVEAPTLRATVEPTILPATVEPTTPPATVEPTAPPATATVEPTAPPAGPEEVLQAYYEALQEGDFELAASLLSDYSLDLAGQGRADIVTAFEKRRFEGWKFLDYEIVKSRMLDDRTALVRAWGKERPVAGAEPETYDVWAPLRREGDGWRVNWGLVIDDRALDVPSQEVNGVIVEPFHVVRLTSGMQLYLRVDNTNERGIFWGWAGETIATFRVEGEAVRASAWFEGDAGIFVEIDGLYEEYPTAVELSNWRWASESSPSLPEPGGERWSYDFDLAYEE